VAVSGEASCLLTGDQDLLILHPFRGIPIMTPAQILASLPRVREDGS
jgi:predicted nucleic acid-binding protein